MYEIGKLLLELIKNNSERKTEIVKKLGYKNMNKGYRRLDKLIHSGECPVELRKKLAAAIGMKPEIVEEAFRVTEIQIQNDNEKKERDNFCPHLYLVHEKKVPSQITLFALTGGIERWKKIKLPETISELKWDVQMKIVRESIKKHRESNEYQGVLLGKVIRYIYRPVYGEQIVISIEGKILDFNGDKIKEPASSVSIGGRKLKKGLLTIQKE